MKPHYFCASLLLLVIQSLFCCRGTSESDARGLLLKLVNLLEFYGMVFFDVRVCNRKSLNFKLCYN